MISRPQPQRCIEVRQRAHQVVAAVVEQPDTPMYASLPNGVCQAFESAEGCIVGSERVVELVEVVQLVCQASLQFRCLG